MGSQERPPQSNDSINLPEGGDDEWSYEVDKFNSDQEHDDTFRERSNKVSEALSEPLSEQTIKDIDGSVVGRMIEHEDEDSLVSPESSLFDREVGSISEQTGREEKDHQKQEDRDKENSYLNLINDLKGENEQGQAKSLNEIWGETHNLKGPDKAEQLRALKVVSLALNESQPAHATKAEWLALNEEEKALVRVAEITKLKVDIEVGSAVYKSKKITAEEKIKHAQELGQVLSDYASGDDIPESVQDEFSGAAARAASVINYKGGEKVVEDGRKVQSVKRVRIKKGDLPEIKARKGEVRLVNGEDNSEIDATNNPEESEDPERNNDEEGNKEQVDDLPEEDDPDEYKLTPFPLESEQPQPEETESTSTSIIDHERFKQEDIPQIEEQLKEHIKNEEHFEAAQLLARTKRLGVSRKEKEGENKLNKYLVDGFDEVLKNNESDGSVSAARYLTYLKYTGVLEGVDKEKKEKMISDVGGAFEIAVADKKEGVNWSLYAMHAKYVGAIDKVDTEDENLLFLQAQIIRNSGDTDKVVVNEARLKYIDQRGEVNIPDKEVQKKLREHASENNYGDYAKLTNAYRYIGGTVAVLDDDMEEMHQYLEARRNEAVQDKKWNKYLADAANAARVEEAGIDEGYIVSMDDEYEDDLDLEYPEEEVHEEVIEPEAIIESEVVDEAVAPDENILTMSKKSLEERIGAIQERAQERREGEDAVTRWAQEVVDANIGLTEDDKEKISADKAELSQKKDQGVNLTEGEKKRLSSNREYIERENRVKRLEAVLEERLNRRIRTNPGEEKALKNYHDLWLNELGRLDAMRKNEKLTPVTEAMMAKAKLGVVKKRIEARQSYINMLRDAALDEENVTADKRALLTSMADEYEELNIQERQGSLKQRENSKLVRGEDIKKREEARKRKKARKKEKKSNKKEKRATKGKDGKKSKKKKSKAKK